MINPLSVALAVKDLIDDVQFFAASNRYAAGWFELGPEDDRFPSPAFPNEWSLFMVPGPGTDTLVARSQAGYSDRRVEINAVKRRNTTITEEADIEASSPAINNLLNHLAVTPLASPFAGALPITLERPQFIETIELETGNLMVFRSAVIYRIPFARPAAMSTTPLACTPTADIHACAACEITPRYLKLTIVDEDETYTGDHWFEHDTDCIWRPVAGSDFHSTSLVSYSNNPEESVQVNLKSDATTTLFNEFNIGDAFNCGVVIGPLSDVRFTVTVSALGAPTP